MADIRPYRPNDLDALYAICLATGDSGADASHIYRDHKLVGHVYAAPYAVLSPKTVFVVEDEEGVGGYIVGPPDTHAFDKKMEAEWWPSLRARYGDPNDVPRDEWVADERMRYLIHHPTRTPRRVSEPYPAHLHINLLPRLQGQRFGAKLIDRWRGAVASLGAPGAHLAVGARNARAVDFYRAYGFAELERSGPPFDVIFFGIETQREAK